MSTKNTQSDLNIAPFDNFSSNDAKNSVHALTEVLASMKLMVSQAHLEKITSTTHNGLPELVIDGLDRGYAPTPKHEIKSQIVGVNPSEIIDRGYAPAPIHSVIKKDYSGLEKFAPRFIKNEDLALSDKGQPPRADASDKSSSQKAAEKSKPSLTGEIRNEDGSVAYTVIAGKVLDKNGKHFADMNADGSLHIKNETTDVNRELVKGLRFEGTENGKRRVFETSESMSEGKIFLPGKDGKQVEYEVRMGMIIDKKTGEQIGLLKAPGESADGKLSGGSIIKFDTKEEVPLRDVKGAVFDLHLMGQRKDVYIKGAALGAADGKNADTGLFNIGGAQAKEVGLVGRATKAAKDASGEQKEDAEFVIKRAQSMQKNLSEMLEKGTSPDARFVQNVESQLSNAEGTLKGDKLARHKHRLDNEQPKLEDLPKDTSKINGWIKLPVAEAGHPNKQLEIKNGMIMAEDGKTAIGRIDDADGRITIMDPSTGKLSHTTIKDMQGSVWHMEYPGKDGKSSQTVNWIALGSEGGVRSVDDLKRKGRAEVIFAEEANKELGETYKSKLFLTQAETNNIDFQMKLDNIIKNGVQSQSDLDLVKSGAKEHVRPEGYRDQPPPEAPSVELPRLTQENVNQVNGRLRIGPESFAIVNGDLYHLESENGQLVQAEKPCGKLGPGYTVSIEGREPVSLADQNRVLLQFTVPGDAREHRIIGLGSGHTSETGKWQRGGLVEADQLLNESGQAYIAALNSNVRYFEERPWTTGALGNAVIGDREGLLKEFANQMEKENKYLKENINDLFSDKGFDPAKESNVQIDHAITSSEHLVANLGWRSKTSEDLANDGIAMQKLVNTSATMVATTVLTAGVGHVLNAAVAAGRLTQGAAYVLEFGTSTAIGATVKAVGQASETSNWKDNAASGALEGAAMAFGSVLGKELGSLSSLKNVKEALELQQAGKVLSAEQSALLKTVVGRLNQAGYSETAIKGIFLATKGADAVVRSTAMNAASSIQNHDWSNFNAKTVAAGALFDVLSNTVGHGANSGLSKLGVNEQGVVARVVNDMAQSYSNSAMSEVQNAINQERQRIAKEMGVTPDMVSDATLDKKISWNNVLNKVNEAGTQAMVTAPLITLATHPLVKMGEHVAKGNAKGNNAHGTEAHEAPAPAPKHEAPAPAPVEHTALKVGQSVKQHGENFVVAGHGPDGKAILHQPGRGMDRAMISEPVTPEQLKTNYEKITVDGNDLYRNKKTNELYSKFPGNQLVPCHTYVFADSTALPKTIAGTQVKTGIDVDTNKKSAGDSHQKVSRDAIPETKIDDHATTVAINPSKARTGDKVRLNGEEFKVVFAAGGEALIHQRERGVHEHVITKNLTKEEFAKFDKFSVDGRELYRKPGDSNMYEVLNDREKGVLVIRVKDYVVAKASDLVVTKPAANVEAIEVGNGGRPIKVERQKGSNHLDKITFPDGRVAEFTSQKGWTEYYPPGHKLEGTLPTTAEVSYHMNKDGTLVRADGVEEVHYKPNGKSELHADRRNFNIHANVSEEFIAKVEKAYLDLPKPLRQLLAQTGQKVHIAKLSTDVRPDYKGMHPRGHEKDATFSCIDGVYFPDKRQVVVAEEYRVLDPHHRLYQKSNRGDGVLRHEVGHAIDEALKYISRSPEFEAAYKKDVADFVSKLKPAERERFEYFLQTPDKSKTLGGPAGQSEVFAEMLGIIYGGGASSYHRKELPKLFPNVKKLMESKLAQYR